MYLNFKLVLNVLIFFTLVLNLNVCIAQVNTGENASLSFKLGEQVFEPMRTNKIGIADLDGDGDLDAVFANMGFNNSQVLFNDGKGYFIDSGQKLTQQGHGIGIGDLDGDGDPDLFIPCAGYSADNGQTWSNLPSKIYFNDSKGRFIDSGQDLGDKELSGTGIHLADIDNDGDLDALVSYYPTENKIYINDGKGNFSDTGKNFPDLIIWGDFDSNGTVDFFEKIPDTGYRTMLNDGKAAFTESWSLYDNLTVRSFGAAGDIDNDGDLDIVMTNGGRADPAPSRVFVNNGKGNFTDSGQELFAAKIGRVGLHDLTGDGYLDAVILSFELPNQIWLNDGSGRFYYSGISLEDNNAFHSCEFGDFDSDGDVDFFLGNYFGGRNQLWFNKKK
ncbi:FG-GAP repeat domain-containing protein [candidate division KSB1 bacterium]